jgi:hypothetical protein
MAEWSKDHVAVICSLILNLESLVEILLTWRPGEAFKWKTKDRRLKSSRSVMWKAGTSKVVAPTCVG